MLFYDEETEDEDEGEDGEGEGQAAAPPPGQGQTDERPESVLTDVTIDGLGDQDIGDMSGKKICIREVAKFVLELLSPEKMSCVTLNNIVHCKKFSCLSCELLTANHVSVKTDQLCEMYP